MSEKESLGALGAAAAVIRNLANGAYSPYTQDASLESDGVEISLPGEDTESKKLLERELRALAQRVQYLEAKAGAASNGGTFPATPNEVAVPTSPFTPTHEKRNPMLNKDSSLAPDRGASLAASLLQSARDGGRADANGNLSTEELSFLQDHVTAQAEYIKNQSIEVKGVVDGLHEQQTQVDNVKSEVERVANLERELKKNQQANEAFQKAFREIGVIVTSVARGDLTKKVLVHQIEMDPEITTFKQTINTMMDQLQTFASEVSRVAREVGTEGRLGGQARIIGVEGTWKELTDNGKVPVREISEFSS
jgi:osomolarity two-component system, sensor histidine kinase NIK1